MFSAEPAARVGHDHPHVLGGHVQRGGQLAADAEGILGARPHRELVAVPLGHGGPGLHRRVLNIGDLVAFVEDLFCARQIRLQRAGQRSFGGLAEMGEKVLARDCCGSVCHLAVLARASTARWASRLVGAAQPTSEPSRMTATPAIDWAGARSIDTQRGAEGGRPEDLAVEHARPNDIGRIAVRPGDDVAAIRPRDAKCPAPSTR